MNSERMVFAQLMHHLPLKAFHRCVKRYKGDRKVLSFSCLDQFLCLAFAQLPYRESLRDIEACLRFAGPKLYHMGLRGRVSRNTLANANEKRDWRIYADFAMVLIGQARELYAKDPFGVNLKNAAYALDATTIDLCLSVFPWAKFRKTKGGVKASVLLDLRGNIPAFIHICPANAHEVKVLDLMVFEASAFYIVDRGHLDFKRLYRLHQSQAFFVTRSKKNFAFDRRESRLVNKKTGVQFDQTVTLSGLYSDLAYPEPLRRIGFIDAKTGKRLRFLTNNFDLSPLTIARRRQPERRNVVFEGLFHLGGGCVDTTPCPTSERPSHILLPRPRAPPPSHPAPRSETSLRISKNETFHSAVLNPPSPALSRASRPDTISQPY